MVRIYVVSVNLYGMAGVSLVSGRQMDSRVELLNGWDECLGILSDSSGTAIRRYISHKINKPRSNTE
jgi:uncharacterized protein HemX